MRDSKDSGHSALRRGRVSLPRQIYHLTVATMDRFPYFHDFGAACAAARCFESRPLLAASQMLAWVLMPDHAHWLVQLGESDLLDQVVNRLKSGSARETNRVLGRIGPLWNKGYYDHALRRDEDIKTIARYIVFNPVRAGLVTKIGNYPFWNAVWLS
ncbi:MAG: transposase [Candidatus Competibacteraceae bacterium]